MIKTLVVDTKFSISRIQQIKNKLRFIGREAVIMPIFPERVGDEELIREIIDNILSCDEYYIAGGETFTIIKGIEALCIFDGLDKIKYEHINSMIIERISQGEFFPEGEDPETPPEEKPDPPINPEPPTEGGDDILEEETNGEIQEK